jgi:integrase
MKVAFCVGLYTGLRLGDVATLEWSEIDFKRNIIQLVPNKISLRKGKRGLIQIPIHPVLCNALLALPGEKINGHVLPEMAALYLAGRRYTITNQIQAHFAVCGIETKKKREQGLRAAVDVGFHSLRHSFVSMCAMNNVPLPVVQSMVGHASALMTGHYAHSNRAAEQAAIALLPAMNGDTVDAAKPTGRTRDELLRELIESMMPKNLREKKAAALAMLAAAR